MDLLWYKDSLGVWIPFLKLKLPNWCGDSCGKSQSGGWNSIDFSTKMNILRGFFNIF